ncbi:hypothetical protein [Chlorobium phaeovibrioides]|uniref:hypothetical protein n=1 Tax=Chlorobium phaeovibrioides TaxID=1094 RepID=UPI001639E77F|nr:hypothetical protein [Chlorobium phaeovibrioides]
MLIIRIIKKLHIPTLDQVFTVFEGDEHQSRSITRHAAASLDWESPGSTTTM